MKRSYKVALLSSPPSMFPGAWCIFRELYEPFKSQVMLATADGGVCEVTRLSHIWAQTREQVYPKVVLSNEQPPRSLLYIARRACLCVWRHVALAVPEHTIGRHYACGPIYVHHHTAKRRALDPMACHFPNTQVTLWNRNGDVALYDDTAVKNRYRMPIGVMVVMIFRVPNANGRPKHHGGYNDGCVRLVILWKGKACHKIEDIWFNSLTEFLHNLMCWIKLSTKPSCAEPRKRAIDLQELSSSRRLGWLSSTGMSGLACPLVVLGEEAHSFVLPAFDYPCH